MTLRILTAILLSTTLLLPARPPKTSAPTRPKKSENPTSGSTQQTTHIEISQRQGRRHRFLGIRLRSMHRDDAAHHRSPRQVLEGWRRCYRIHTPRIDIEHDVAKLRAGCREDGNPDFRSWSTTKRKSSATISAICGPRSSSLISRALFDTATAVSADTRKWKKPYKNCFLPALLPKANGKTDGYPNRIAWRPCAARAGIFGRTLDSK